VKLTETPPYQALRDEAVFNIVLATIAIEICFMREFWGFWQVSSIMDFKS
jgi:hypothetical protein